MTEVAKKSDSEIQQEVMRELKWDTRIEETEVGVEVDDGIVTLTGTVDSWAKRIAAQEAAHRVRAVLDVANDIEVKPLVGKVTDTDIARAVRQALEWDVFVPHERIRSSVSKGRVTLEGSVDYWSQRSDAERAVRNLSGVTSVSNNVVIKPPKTLVTEDVRKAIQEALERQAEREARQIEVKISDGRVTISGSVHSWAEQQAIIGAARGTRGVRSVENHLRIQPYD